MSTQVYTSEMNVFWAGFIPQMAAIAVRRNLDLKRECDFEYCLYILQTMAFLN